MNINYIGMYRRIHYRSPKKQRLSRHKPRYSPTVIEPNTSNILDECYGRPKTSLLLNRPKLQEANRKSMKVRASNYNSVGSQLQTAPVSCQNSAYSTIDRVSIVIKPQRMSTCSNDPYHSKKFNQSSLAVGERIRVVPNRFQTRLPKKHLQNYPMELMSSIKKKSMVLNADELRGYIMKIAKCHVL